MGDLKNKVTSAPNKPGVYQFHNNHGKVLYVGKAKDLKKRLGQYFGQDKRVQLPFLMAEAVDFDYTVTNSELEALFLENTLIKQYLPPYNIILRDDKNYAFIKIDYSTEIPQIGYARKIEPSTRKLGNLETRQPSYFGPYSSAIKIKKTLDTIRKIFSYCANKQVGKRPCFYYYLHRCPGVCVGKISLAEYDEHITRIAKFLAGDSKAVSRELKNQMHSASGQKKFELAGRLRDQIRALELLQERQTALFPQNVNWDFVSVFSAYGDHCINLFKVRSGKLMDKENFIYTATQEQNQLHVLERFLETYYQDASHLPKEIFIQLPVTNTALIQSLIKNRLAKSIHLTVPTRGQKKQLITLGVTNAEEYLKKWQTTQVGSQERMRETLEQLQKLLKLPTFPHRIEGYDISNTQGTNPVGSMVVAVDGFPAKAEYRKFKITTKQSPDDFAMMREMLTRRLARISNNQLPISKKDKQADTWPTPDLIMIDGGKGQLKVAVETIRSSLNPKPYTLHPIPVIGLAKRIEEIFLPGKSKPIVLDHGDPVLHVLQRLRDEAHRFGITFHKSLRSKQAVKSALDTIPGIGPKTKKLLKTHFGTIANIRTASVNELIKIVGADKAKILKKNL